MKKIVLLIEGEIDKIIVEKILIAAKIPLTRFEFHILKGKKNLNAVANSIALEKDELLAALIDLDSLYVEDAKIQSINIQKKSSVPIEIFFAVPEIESWALADEQLILQETINNLGRNNIFERLPFPDEIPYPKFVLNNLLRKKRGKDNKDKLDFLSRMNISKATSRSPSLSFFLKQISNILDIKVDEIKDSISKNIDKKIFINLIKEISNSETIMYKTLDGFEYSARQLVKEIENGTEVGKAYSSDILRIARDILKRNAKKL